MRVLHNIAELATCPPGGSQSDAGILRDAALVIDGEQIAWAGPAGELPADFAGEEQIDCDGRLVIPGLVDCHTHLCFGGWRGDEFEMRLAGASYQEIARAGGGIRSTVEATRNGSAESLERKAADALRGMLALGVTTAECKSGYGLEEANEIKQLEIYQNLNSSQPIELIPTFIGAHIIPPEFTEDRDRYISLICDKLIPEVASRGLAVFCDAFVEKGAYTADEARKIFTAARNHGLKIKLHADQLSDGGGASLAAEFDAVSAEHLEYVNDAGIAALCAAGTVAVSLPLASLYLGERYVPARKMLESGVRVAVATDFNPGSAPSYHLPLAMTLACLNQYMTPQEVLNGVTTVAARAIDQHDRIGSLLPGFQADIAVIDAPSLNHWLYHFVPNACLSVFKKGRKIL
jgi:imidazolonepropionase